MTSDQGRNGDNDTDVQLSPGEIDELLTAISPAFPTDAGAGRLLRRIGYPPDRIPPFTGFRDDAWYAVFNAFDNGIITAPYRKVLVAALHEYPANPKLLQLAQRHGLTPKEAPVPARRRLTLGPERRLIDRVDEVAVLRSELSRVIDRQVSGRLLLMGDSGVGKTRLAEQGMEIAYELGMAVLRAPCINQNADPLLPLRAGLLEYREATPVRDLLRAGGDALVAYAPFLESFLGIGGAEAAAAPLGGQDVAAGLAEILVGLAGPAGLCLVVEDLTDADPQTIEFLDYLHLGIMSATSRLVTITTVREDFLEESNLIDRIDKWREKENCTVSRVSPLARKDTAEFIALLQGDRPVAPEWVNEIYELTGGNPFFVEQVVRLYADGQQGPAGQAGVPDRIDAVFKRRLRRLTDDARFFLEAAAVALDVTHRPDLVAHVTGVDAGAASARLRQAVRQRFLTEDAQGNVAFPQELLRRVLYDEIPPGERTTMNVRAAQWLEGEALFASASHHYDRAGRTADMIRTALAGADQAEHSGTYSTAVQLYLRARPAGDPVAIGLRLARVYLILGAWNEAEGVLAGLPGDLGEARVLRSELFFVRGAFDRALRELQLASQDPAVDETEALIRLADIHLYLGRLRTAIDLAEKALLGTKNPTNRARCLDKIGTSRYCLGDFTGAEEAYLAGMQALPEEVEQRDRFAYTIALHNFASAREARGNWAGAKRFHEEALRLRLEVSAAREVGHSRHSIIRCHVALGEFDTSRRLLAEARAAAVALGEELEQGKLDHTEARIELLTGGDPNVAVRLLEGARDRFRDMHVAYDIAHASFTLAWAYAAAGAQRRSVEEAAAARAQMGLGEFGLLALLYPDTAYWYRDRVVAGLLGYAAGDAVGLPWEGTPPGQIDPARLPSLHATKHWPAGATSDDTALTLLAADQLIGTGRADGRAFLERLAAAAPSIDGLGPSTTAAIEGFRRTGEPPSGDGNTNGAVMRSLPIGWALSIDRVRDRREWVIELSRATHPGPEAITAACVGAACAAWAIEDAPTALLLEIAREEAAAAVRARSADPRIEDMLAAVAAGTWRPDPTSDDLDPYETVTRALWCIATRPSLGDALLAAVRMGGDTDTVAALVGGLLGCQRSPEDVRGELPWIDEVHLPAHDIVRRIARGIADLRIGQGDG